MISLKIFFTQRKYFASAFLFGCFSLIFSTWITYIPIVAEKLSITEGKIGGAIFFASLGAFVMIPFANMCVKRLGEGRMTYFSLLAYSLSLLGPFLASTYFSLCVALFFFGLLSSAYAIGLNSLTATIEKQDGVFIMSGSHGFWSVGGVVGASSGSLLAAWLGNPLLHASLIIVVVVGLQTYYQRFYFHRNGSGGAKSKLHFIHFKPLFIIAFFGLIFMVAEGAIADWSALFLKKIVGTPISMIGMGYAAFSLGMVIGRFNGDYFSQRFGSWKLLTYSSLISLVGFGLVLVAKSIIPVAGFFIVGLGFSVIVPEVYRLASRVENVKTSDGVALISATTNIGFLVGPVLLGFLAEWRSLHFSFLILTFVIVVAFITAMMKNNNH